MIEIRWVKDEHGIMQLQQRTRNFCVDASGAFCQFTEWSEWVPVPVVDDMTACMEESGFSMDATNLQTPEEMLERWSVVQCQCDPSVGHLCECCHDTQVVRDLIKERDRLRDELQGA